MKLLHIAMDERQKSLIANGANQPNASDGDGNKSMQGVSTGTIGPIPNLELSVKPPWERATTPANVPYYIKYALIYCVSPACTVYHKILLSFSLVMSGKIHIGIIQK